jgi:hypothetical protein
MGAKAFAPNFPLKVTGRSLRRMRSPSVEDNPFAVSMDPSKIAEPDPPSISIVVSAKRMIGMRM